MMMIAGVDPHQSKAENQLARQFFCACTFENEKRSKKTKATGFWSTFYFFIELDTTSID
jgi:hypothetical protein